MLMFQIPLLQKKKIYMCSEGKGKQLKLLTDYVWWKNMGNIFNTTYFPKFNLISIYCLNHFQISLFFMQKSICEQKNIVPIATRQVANLFPWVNITIDSFQQNKAVKLYIKRIVYTKTKHIIISLQWALIIVTKILIL